MSIGAKAQRGGGSSQWLCGSEPASCIPTWARTPGRVPVEVAFVFYLHANNTMEALSTKRGLPPHSIAMGKGLPSAERLVRTPGCRSPFRAQKGPEKGPAAVSNSEGRTVLSSGPRLPLLPSYREPSWTPRALVDARCRTPLSAMDEKLLELRRERDDTHSLLQRWERSEARWPRLASISRHIKTVWYASHIESEVQFTLFWFRMRWFFIIIFLGRRTRRNQKNQNTVNLEGIWEQKRDLRGMDTGSTLAWRPLPAAPGT